MKPFLIILISLRFTLTVYGQIGSVAEIDSLSTLERGMKHRESYDSAINVCKHALSLNRKYAKEDRLDRELVDLYFAAKRYDKAKKYGNRYLHSFVMPKTYSRESYGKRAMKGGVCQDFYLMYKEQGNSKRELKYLKLWLRKYAITFDYSWILKKKICQYIIDCYTAIGDQKNADKYQKKKDKIEIN